MSRPTALVLANCTHYSLSTALIQAKVFEEVDSHALYALTSDERREIFDSISKYDYILTLFHGSSYNELSTCNLKSTLGSRVVSVPTPYFSGLFPDKCYLTHGTEIAKCNEALGDYHSAVILNDSRMGYSPEEIARRYESGESFETLDIDGLWRDSLEEIKKRDEVCDIQLSAYIQQTIDTKSIQNQFLTINHPTEKLINYIACSFIRKTLSQSFPERELIGSSMHCLNRGAIIPIHDFIADKIGILKSQNSSFQQPEDLGGQKFSLAQFAKLSAEYFKKFQILDDFCISSPHYLRTRITMHSKKIAPISLIPQVSLNQQLENVMSETESFKFILFQFGRSGSKVLSQMLSQHSDIICHGELLSSPDTYQSRYRVITSDSLVDIIENELHIKDNAKSAHHCIEVKLSHILANPFSSTLGFFQALKKRGNYKLVLLKRENTLMRLLSAYKASQTGIYHLLRSSSQKEIDAAKSPIYLNLQDFLMDWDTAEKGNDICDLIEKARIQENQAHLNMLTAGFQPLILTYEDHLESDPVKAYTLVLSYLSLPYQPAEVWLTRTSYGTYSQLVNHQELAAILHESRYKWMISSHQSDSKTGIHGHKIHELDVIADYSKPIFQLLQHNLPLESLRQSDSKLWAFRDSWSGDDILDSNGVLEALHSLWDSQSVAFMVDLIPYFLDILKDDDAHAYWIHEPMLLLDVGARTGAGSDLLGSMFFGGASRRRAVVDVLDIDPTFAEFVEKTKRFVRRYIVSDISAIPTGAYDYVFASHVIEHIQDPGPFCEELKRISRKKVICYTPFDEADPIPSHHTINMDTLRSINAKRIEVTDKSWPWKHPNKHQFTVMFYLESSNQ